ncbi:MAG: O-antigen ligase family protein, partial [Candidatus Aminicenantes bacterium]|nr:O-antigen ligase family protein [Candidatus Aminicenantes bacterium]
MILGDLKRPAIFRYNAGGGKAGLKVKARRALFYLAGSALYVLAFGAFYRKYVPLIPGFQAAFLPVGLLVAGLTAWKPALGGAAFLGAFPLVNNWPYFFGVQQDTPHAPTSLVLALFLFLGLFLRGALGAAASGRGPEREGEIPGSAVDFPLRFAAAVVAVSAVVAYWKWTHFYPLRADGIYELTANVNGVTTGGARMSTIFSALSYLAGFALFAFFVALFQERKARRKAAVVLAGSLLAAAFFGLVQAAFDPSLGNTGFWVALKQINATFKDPNAFGGAVSGLVPFFAGAAIASAGPPRRLCLAAVALAILVFPFIGVRSAVLGLGAAALAGLFFAVLDRRGARREDEAGGGDGGTTGRRRKRRPVLAAAGLIGLLAAAAAFGVLSDSRLHERMKSALGGGAAGGGVVGLSPERYFLWREAVRMMGGYPLTGVGVGSYIVELPNYYERDKTSYPAGFEGWRRIDSAENYFLQAGAEMGLPGLAAVLGVFWAVGWEAARGLRRRTGLGRDRFFLYGAAAGLVSLGVNMLFHSYLASFETQFVFWILAAFVAAVAGGGDGVRGPGRKEGRPFGARAARLGLALALILYAGWS